MKQSNFYINERNSFKLSELITEYVYNYNIFIPERFMICGFRIRTGIIYMNERSNIPIKNKIKRRYLAFCVFNVSRN